MIRPFTLICVLLFLFSGFYDYQVTHRVDLLDQKIAAVRTQAADVRSDSKMLQTEWSWLNRPDRLQPFASQFTALQGVSPSQYVPIAQLAQHLPQAGAAPITAAQLAAADQAVAQRAATAKIMVAAAAQPVDTNTKQAVETAAVTPEKPPLAAMKLAAVKLAAWSEPAALASIKIAPVKPAPEKIALSPHPAAKPELAASIPPLRPPARDSALAALDRELSSPPATPRDTPSLPGEAHRPAAPAHPVVLARAKPLVRPGARPVMVADNAPVAAAPRSASALGMAQAGYALPAPVAVTDVSYPGRDQ